MSNLVSMSEQFSGLPMDALIGAPLIAATEANSKMSQSQKAFLLDTCFENIGGKDSSLNPIMIKMKLNNNGSEITFDIPLMTFISINTLGIDEIKIHFEMEVKSSFEETKEETKKLDLKGSASARLGFLALKATVSYDSSKSENTHYQKSNSAKYSVDVHAAQLPIPQGIQTVLDAFTKSIDSSQAQ